MTTFFMENKRALIILIAVLTLLSIPMIAMQFSNEVNWSAFDFIVAGILLFGTAFTLEIVFRTIKTKRHRMILSIVIMVLLIVVWLELAVGIFGTPLAGS